MQSGKYILATVHRAADLGDDKELVSYIEHANNLDVPYSDKSSHNLYEYIHEVFLTAALANHHSCAEIIARSSIKGSDFNHIVASILYRGGCRPVYFDMLVEHGHDINWNKAMCNAAACNNLEMVQFFINKGADPNYGGAYAFSLACSHQHDQVARHLLPLIDVETHRHKLINELMGSPKVSMEFLTAIYDQDVVKDMVGRGVKIYHQEFAAFHAAQTIYHGLDEENIDWKANRASKRPPKI